MAKRQKLDLRRHRQLSSNGVDFGSAWIPDEICFHIYSFLHFTDLATDETEEDLVFNTCGVSHLQREVGFISTGFLASVVRHAQKTPLVLHFPSGCHRLLEKIAWACSNGVKIGRCVFSPSGRSENVLCMHILKSCDITALKALRLYTYSRPLYNVGSVEEIKAAAVQAGIPSDIFEQDGDMSFDGLHSFIANYVPPRSPLEKITFGMQKVNYLQLPLLTNSYRSLKGLTILAPHDTCPSSSDILGLSRAIEQLPYLQKLVLGFNFKASFRISSKSLQTVDTSLSGVGFFVTECICPSLKMFSIKTKTRNGLKPVFSFSKTELKTMREDKLELLASSRPFIGMRVPGTCIVRMSRW